MSAQKNLQPQVLIVGGASFLGSKLTAALLSQNCTVTVIDDIPAITAKNLKEFLTSPNFKFEKCDITKELPGNLQKFTHVYHLAGIEEFLTQANLSHVDLLINSAGTENLLKLATDSQAKFILVSTLDVYAGIISQTSLENYFGPKSVDFAHFTHHEAKRFAESLTASYFQNFGVDCSIGRIAQIYGPGMPLDSDEIIARLINQAITTDSLSIPGDGLEILHPTYIEDVVWGLVKIGFSQNSKGGIYNLVSPDEVTVLEFANRLKATVAEIDKEKILEIKFESSEKPMKFPIPKVELTKTERDLGWTTRVELKEGLRQTLEFFLAKDKEIQFPKPETAVTSATQDLEESTKVIPPVAIQTEIKKFQLPKLTLNLAKFFPKPNFLIFATLLLIFLLLIVPLGQIGIGLGLSFKNFQDAKVAFFQAEFEKAQSQATSAASAARFALLGFARFSPVFRVFGAGHFFEALNDNFEGIEKALIGFESLAEVGKIGTDLGKNVISGKGENLDQEVAQLSLKFDNAVTSFETAKLDLSEFKLRKVPFLGKRVENLILQFEVSLPNLKKGANFAKILPELIAIDDEKTYLVLFENNSELRPGGGFIGSYGIFKFEKGKLTQPVIDDIYNLDGQLKVKIPPPPPLKQHLGIENLGLRDSNWSYDFSQNGATATSFYQQITGKNLDGVIGVDVTAFGNLLKVLGSVKLPDYEEEITAQNLAERAEFYSEIGFFPGSTSKKDFLGSLARQVILKLQKGTGFNYFEILGVLGKVADEKHINFYFPSEKLATFFAEVNWSGQIKSISTLTNGQSKIVSDFLAISEANVGANKSNRFVEKKIDLVPVILRDGDLITTLTLDFANKSPAPTWPGGNYKNYLRIITPIGSKLEQFLIDDQDVTALVEQTTEFDKQIFAAFFEVPAGEERKVKIIYRPNYRIEIQGDKATYNILVQKQPGTGTDPVNIDLAYPAYLKNPKTNLPAKFLEQRVNLDKKLLTDFTFAVEFSL